MCVLTEDVKIAEGPIKVYKVMELVMPNRFIAHPEFVWQFICPWKTMDRIQIHARDISAGIYYRIRSVGDAPPITLVDITRSTAIGFDEGLGYCVFRNEEDAKTYCHALWSRFPLEKHSVIELVIPKGAKYAEGKIASGTFMAGMSAIRTEELAIR